MLGFAYDQEKNSQSIRMVGVQSWLMIHHRAYYNDRTLGDQIGFVQKGTKKFGSPPNSSKIKRASESSDPLSKSRPAVWRKPSPNATRQGGVFACERFIESRIIYRYCILRYSTRFFYRRSASCFEISPNLSGPLCPTMLITTKIKNVRHTKMYSRPIHNMHLFVLLNIVKKLLYIR